MGASALTADIGTVCVPLALGSAVGSSCTAWHDQLSQRVCVVDGPSGSALRCASAGCSTSASELPFAVMGVVHDVELVRGIVGTFTDNEPVIGVRARTLPYTQAIGRPAPDQGGTLPLQRYTFGNFPFLLPGMLAEDEVVIAFGTRTVVRLPLLGASNAPLNFDVLGSISMPLGRLLQGPQPVEVSVPIQPRGENLPQVARAFLTFGVAPQSLAGGPVLPAAADDTDAVELEGCVPGFTERLAQDGRKANAGQCANFSGAHQFNAV
uniref:Uncharacterized protein n=1 Tax=Alexandrium monilatum TaxID=311494 RepID=A0A7S4PRM7_9DINO